MRMAALHFHSRIKVRVRKTMPDGTVITGYRLILHLDVFMFNEILPQDLGFVDRSIPEQRIKA